MGRPRKYTTRAKLDEAVERYFRSISRTVDATEEVPTGLFDDRGRQIMRLDKIYNDDGRPIRLVRYVKPPTVSSLCLFLGITRQTWAEYCDADRHPEFLDTTARTRARMECWLEEQLLTRQKGVQGIIFNLTNNYGWSDKREIELGGETRRAVAGEGLSVSDKLGLIAAACEDFAASRDYTAASGELPGDGGESGEPHAGSGENGEPPGDGGENST